jgi:hypothetical protein
MKQRTRRTEIILETHELTVIRKRSGINRFCVSCRRFVPTFTHEELLMLFRMDAAKISSFEVSGELHFVGNRTGLEPLVCGDSLKISPTSETKKL